MQLQKIIFHTSACFGWCPTYHLEIDSLQNGKLYAQTVYKEPFGKLGSEEGLDSAKMGYFKGKLHDTAFNKLINELNKVGLDSLEFDGSNCCDGSIKTIIIYYDGKRKYLRAMFPPDKAEKLIAILYRICESNNFRHVEEKFEIELPHY